MFNSRIYLQIWKDRVVARNIDSGETAQELPNVPYHHSRMLIGDIDSAELAVATAIQKVKSRNPLNSISMVVHPVHDFPDGVTLSEKVIFRMLGYDARAKKVVLHFGSPISDNEVGELLKGVPN